MTEVKRPSRVGPREFWFLERVTLARVLGRYPLHELAGVLLASIAFRLFETPSEDEDLDGVLSAALEAAIGHARARARSHDVAARVARKATKP